jgi:DNA polymerase-1
MALATKTPAYRTITYKGNKFIVVQSEAYARKLIKGELANAGIAAFDFETTALWPDRSDKHSYVRISSICIDPGTVYVLDHNLCGSFASLADDLAMAAAYYVFNSKFEIQWFDAYTSSPLATLYDVSHMRRSVLGGGPLSLKTQVKFDLGIDLDKEEQRSDWGAKELTGKQYVYAGNDALVTLALAHKWEDEMEPHHWSGFHVINDSVRAVVEMEQTGILLDIPYHKTLCDMWARRKATAIVAIRKLVPEQYLHNINSKLQLSNFLRTVLDQAAIDAWPKTEKTGQLQTDRNILRGMSFQSPYPFSRFLAALMVYNRATKYISTYGEVLINKQELSRVGRIMGRLNIAQAITGRFSSSDPNMQNFPRAYAVRYSFTTALGTTLCLADYSGIEVRVLAEMSQDKTLLHDCIYGDVHAESAIVIYKLDPEKFKALLKAKDPRAKELRSKAKGFTFQLLYGAGVAALAIVLRCSLEEAQDAVDSWSGRYSKAYRYRYYMLEKMKVDGFLQCASGRTIYVRRQDRTVPVASNYPIQGSAADVMYRACYHVHRMLVEKDVKGHCSASIHDELILVADDSDAEAARQILQDGMIMGWLDIFPGTNTDNLVEAVTGHRWSDKA